MSTFNKITSHLRGKTYDEREPAKPDTSNLGFCPLHNSKKRSLKYKQLSNCLFEFHCFEGCSSLEIEENLKEQKVLPESYGFEGFEGEDFKLSRIFESSQSVSKEGPVNTYLSKRGLKPISSNDFIKEKLDFKYSENGEFVQYGPAMVSRIIDVKTRLTIGHQITHLTEEGEKAKLRVPKRIIGKLKNGVVKIAGANEEKIILTEGIENAMTISHSYDVSVYATLSAFNLILEFLPEDISGKELIIYADKDKSMTGESYAVKAKTHYEDNYNTQVNIKYPEEDVPSQYKGLDFNDLIRKGEKLDSKYSPFKCQDLSHFFDHLKNQHSKPSIPKIEPEFDLESMVPNSLHDFLKDESKRLSIRPESLYVVLLTSISSIVGRRYCVQPKNLDPSWTVVPTLWCLIVNHPSTRKSATIKAGTKFLEKIQKNHLKTHRDQEQDRQVQRELLEEREKAIKKKLNDDLDNPKLVEELVEAKNLIKKTHQGPRRYLYNDSTMEKVIALAESNPNGLTMVRDELGGFLGQLNKKGYEGSREFYLEGWNGNGSYTKDTLSRGTNFVEGLALNIIAGTQPDTFSKLLRNTTNGKDDGFTQRFQLLLFPDPLQYNFVNQALDQRAYSGIQSFFDATDEIEPNTMRIIKFSENAQRGFASFCEWINNASFKSQLLKTHISKYDSLVAKLALLYELLQKGPSINEITEESLNMAISMSYFLASHADRLFFLSEQQSSETKTLLLQKIKENQLVSGMTLRELKQKGWKGVYQGSALDDAIKQLEGNHILSIKRKESLTGGRPSERILINPLFSYFV